MSEEKTVTRSIPGIKDRLGDGKINFYPGLPRIEDFAALLASKFTILDAKVVEDWDGKFGTSTFVLLKLKLEDGSEKTTCTSGRAVVRQIKKLLKMNALPVSATLNMVTAEGTGLAYYVLE